MTQTSHDSRKQNNDVKNLTDFNHCQVLLNSKILLESESKSCH